MAWAWCIVRRSKHKFTRTNWTCCSMNRSKQMIWNRRWSDDLFYYWILLCQSIVVQFSTMFFFFFVHLFGMLACMFAFQMKVHNLTSTSNQVHRNILSKKCCFFTFFFPLLSFCLRFFFYLLSMQNTNSLYVTVTIHWLNNSHWAEQKKIVLNTVSFWFFCFFSSIIIITIWQTIYLAGRWDYANICLLSIWMGRNFT